jgi:hypothetical protein
MGSQYLLLSTCLFFESLSIFYDFSHSLHSPSISSLPFLTFSLCRGKAVVKSKGDRFRDTAALTVRADGIDLPPFLIKGQVGNASIASGRRPKRGEKPVRGMNKNLMKVYADHIAQYVTKPSLLILDRASSHTSRVFIDYVEAFLTADGEQNFEVLLLPAKTAFLVSGLYNGANSAFKQHFYKYDRSTFPLKQSAVKLAWDAVSNESLANISDHCGLNANESMSSIHQRFENEVHGVIPEKLVPSLELYEQWIAGSISVDGAYLHRGVELERPMQMNDGTMDGIKWVEWGTRESSIDS